jgi:exopolyphosphatase/pppGpp-phosphohydrolase
MDIGTRATRMLIGDPSRVERSGSFSFRGLTNRGVLTYAGEGMRRAADGTMIFEIIRLERTVECLRSFVSECSLRGIQPERIVAVGTEVFRAVSNWREIAELVSCEIGARLLVLDHSEEARTTFFAAMVSCREYYEPGEPFLVIEQGGGSTQLTVAEVDRDLDPVIHWSAAFGELGTVFLRMMVMEHEEFAEKLGLSPRARLKTVQEAANSHAVNLIRRETARLDLPHGKMPRKAFALGGVVTDFFPKATNERIHGRLLERHMLEPGNPPDSVLSAYAGFQVRSLQEDLRKHQIPEITEDQVCEELERLYGMQCYAAVLDAFGLDSIRICGTGLRYGVFFRLAFGQWMDVKEFQG